MGKLIDQFSVTVRNGVTILCRLQKYWYKLYHIKSYNCTFVSKFIKIYSLMKVSLLYVSIIYAFFQLHLQIVSIFYFTSRTVCSPTRSGVCHCINHSVFQCLHSQWLYYYIHYYKNVFAHECYCYAYDSNSFSFLASVLEYTNVIHN